MPEPTPEAMPVILARLVAEHRNFARLLEILEAEIARLEQGENADFRIISDIMRYVGVYPDMVHHPTEDRVFKRLIELCPPEAGLAGDLLAEHDRLRRLGHSFSGLVQGILGGAITPLDRVRSVGREYVDLCRAHGRWEENEFFPRAREVLTAEDWERIQADISSYTDPLFGDIIDQSYRYLYDMIERASS